MTIRHGTASPAGHTPAGARPARAVHRSYIDGGQRAPQVRRFHIIREDTRPDIGMTALCGQPMWAVTRSQPLIYDPMPTRPPEGLTWCPHCIGRLAERVGRLAAVASDLARWRAI